MSTTVEGIKSLLKTNRPLSTLEASGWDTPESASFADDDRRTRNLASMITAALPPRMAPLGQALNEHVSLRFVKAGIASTQHPSTSVASEAVDVIMDAIVFFQARPEHASCSSNINENDNGSSGSGNGGFVYLLDMSLPKALEKAVAIQLAAETAADAKSRHIAFMSHEIRNPVNGILASVEAIDDMLVLIRKPTDEQGDSQLAEVEDLVKTTLACTEQLRRTVDDILDFNKLEEGKLVLLKESFFLERMLRSVMMQVKSAAQVKGLKLLTQISPLLRHATLLGDVGRIQQVLTNFCWNAVKFTPKGSITIEVSCEVPEGGIIAANKVCTSSEAEANGIIETGETGGDSVGNSKDDAPLQSITLYFKVIDTGEGMSKATMENIFERFTMGEHKCGKYGGSGLGLTICRSLAELMQGEIHCMSTPAGGSTFVLELSLEIESTNEPQALASRVLDHGYPQSSALPPKEIKDMNESEAEVGEGAGITQEMCNGGGCVEPPGMARVKKPSFSSHSQRSISVEATAMISLDAEGNIELPRQFSRSPDTSKPEQSHDDGVSERARVAGKAARCSAYSHHEQSQSTQLPQSYLEQQHQEQPYQPGQWNEHSERIQAWQMRVVREQVGASSVAVLVEVCTGQEVRQHWGGAPVGEGGIGPAMARAQEDGLARALWLFPPESGTLSSSRRIPAPSASRETGTWCSAACDVPNSQRSQPSRPVSRPSSSVPTSSTPTHDSSMNHAARHPAHRQGQDLPIIVSRPPSRPPSRPRTPPPTGAQNMPMREMSENKQAGGGALAGIGGVHSAETIPDTHSAKTGILPGAGSAGSLHGFDRSENQGKSATSATAGAAAKELAASSLSSVLVVDDDKINVKVLKRIFVKAEGIVVTTGEDGTDVVRLLVNQNLRFDAVLLDENMRHMNGSIATAELRKHEARKGEVMPQLVIATTGNFAAQDVYRYQKAGYNAMLIKPMNVKLLVKCVADYHAFWKHTAGAGTVWNPGQELPPECPAPDVRDTSFFVDGYFFGNLEVFGNIPRFY
jgi:signal transduction histidine kinase/CheY-like chemotaxis protein